MGHTACTEPQCLHKGALYLYHLQYFMHRFTAGDADINFLSVDKFYFMQWNCDSSTAQNTYRQFYVHVTDNKILPCKIKPIIYLSVTKQMYEIPKDTDVTYSFYEYLNTFP
jgi:hypothetical protein